MRLKMASTLVFTTFVLSFFNLVNCLASTDTITWGGDNSRTGYQTNHNMDPLVVGSPQFGMLFQTTLPGNYGGFPEQIFSQPLVYTPADGIQYVYIATTQNNVYKLDAKTGAILTQRNLHIPFLTADLNGCVDINPHVGVTATGVIDPDTDTLYLTSKTYANQTGGSGPQGKPNGRYYLHALDVNDLSERANFPVNLEGTVARNNPIRSFNGGTHHQRPGLLNSGQYIYAGFASHCVQYNFTGWIMGWDKTTGATVERYAMEGAGVPNTTPGGGVWMSGGGLSSDDAGSMFYATGNGYASQLNTIPVNGHNPPTALEEAAVHMTINDDGSLTIVDFFMPWEKTQLDGADRDLGTTPLELLPSEFSCGDIKHIGVVTGKSGKTYWLNLDNLGGYQNGPNKLDNVIQVYQNENSVYSGAGVYPLEGGYIYINVIQYPTHVFKFSCDNGVPSFSKVADSPTNNAYILGVGHGTVTSLNGQPGTGLVWTCDVQGPNLRIYNAVPYNGTMTMINSFNVPGITKFTRAVFGDGRVYMGSTIGVVYGFGSPINLPINCSSPYEFGTSNLNTSTASMVVQCQANIGVTVSSINLADSNDFGMTGLPTIPFTVAAGSSFSFEAYFNPQVVGPISSDVVVDTINDVAGYSTSTPISLSGTGQSVTPLLSVSPNTLSFQGVITGQQVGGVNETVIFSNLGNSELTISSIQYSQTSDAGPYIAPNISSSGTQVGPFTFIGIPSVIPGNSDVIVTVNFNTPASGNFVAYLLVNSNGGKKSFVVAGTSGAPPVALLEFQTPDGLGWVPYEPGTNFTFGNVTENTTRFLKMRLTNNATTDSARLSLTVSKPPFGVPGIIGAANEVDLAEGTTLAPGENATAMLYCSVPKEQWNTDPYYGGAQWTMNVNDPNFGKHFIQFSCTAVSEQAPPLLPNGQGLYRYEGCYKENNPGRQLQTQIYGNNNNNSNEMCIAACAAGGYTFCGTQYTSECWAGPTIPVEQVDDDNCNYPCTGNVNGICGGNGVGSEAGGAYISLFSRSGPSGGGSGVAAPSGPITNSGVGGYTSIGCYTEATYARALPNYFATTNKTVAMCISSCSASGYIYAGLEYGGECWCGDGFSAGAIPAPLTDCSMTCDGNSSEYCGAADRLDVYELSSAVNQSSSTSSALGTSTSSALGTSTSSVPVSAPTGPTIKQIVGSWQFQGCWTEATTVRALSSNTYASNSMTLESCAAFCQGYQYFGTEYGRECYCGNSLGAGSVMAVNQADCSFPCSGANFEYCGGSDRLELYSFAPSAAATSSSLVFSPTSSITTSVSSISSTTTGGASSSLMGSSSLSATLSTTTLPKYSTTISVASTAATSKGSAPSASTGGSSSSSSSTSSTPLSTLSFTTSSTITTTSMISASSVSLLSSSISPSVTASSATLSSPSISSATSVTSTTKGSSSISSTSSSSSASTGTTSSITPPKYSTTSTASVTTTNTGSNSPISPVSSPSTGGVTKSSTTLLIQTITSSMNSVTSTNKGSVSSVSSTGSSSSTRSTLSTTLSTSVITTSVTSKTSTTSSSSSSTSSVRTSSSSGVSTSSKTVASSSSSSASSAAHTGRPVTSTGNVNFTYYSCVTEPSSGRVLASQVYNDGVLMTIERCLSRCYMYQYAGVEYGRECWCGNTLNFKGNPGATPGGNVSDSRCSFTCPGNSSEYCGAGLALNLYWFDLRKALANSH